MKRLPGRNGSNNSTHHGITCVLQTRLSLTSHRRPATRRRRPSCRPPHRRGRPADGLVTRNRAPHREETSTFTLGAAPMAQHNARSVAGTRRSCLSDTRLARAELLGNVDIVEGTHRHRLVIRLERKAQTHSDNVISAVNTAAVVVVGRHRPCRPCSSKCTIKKPRKDGKMCLERVATKLAVQSSSTDRGAKTMGPGTRMTNFCVPSASRKPFPENWKSSM